MLLSVLTLGAGVGRARLCSGVGSRQARVEGGELLLHGCGSEGVKGVPCGAGVVSAHG